MTERFVTTARRLPLGVMLFVGVVALFLPFARLGVDPHHDGIMLRPALVVAEGGVIHRDAFSQYGPMGAWVQGLGVLLFGPTLFAIRLTTVIALAAATGMFATAWSRLYGRGVACWAVGTWLLLTPFFSVATPMHPWSSDICLAFQALALLAVIEGLSRAPARSALVWFAVAGAAGAAAAMARLTVGILALAAVGILLLVARRWSLLAAFAGGAAFATLTAAAYLGFTGALDDWWEQSILLPSSWHENVIGDGGKTYVREKMVRVAAPGLAVITLTAGGVVAALVRLRGRSRAVLASVVPLLATLAAFVLAFRHDDVPFWNRSAAFWVVALAGAVLPGVVMFGRASTDRELGRTLGWAIGVASLVQIYPVADARHLWWSVLPILGPLGAAVVSLTRGAGVRTLAAASLLLLVPFAGQSVRETFRTARVSLPDSPVLDHMLMDANYARYFTANLRAVQQYVEAHDNPPVFNMCADGLFAALSPNLDAPDPWFVFWTAPRPLDEVKRGEFIMGRRPIAWLCPPSLDPDQIARGWSYRLLPQDPALAGDPDAPSYPYASVVAVPAEWPALEAASDTDKTRSVASVP